MKVDKVILSSTCDDFYLDFWPIVSKIWKIKFDIHPVLYLIHDNDYVKASEEHGTVIYVKPIEKVPVSVQASCCRFFFPRTEPDTTWMVSDIDMFPISKKYFIDNIVLIPNDKFVNLNYGPNYPACYVIANGSTFIDVLKLPETFEQFLKQIEWWKLNTQNTIENSIYYHWGIDEYYVKKMVDNFYDSTKFVNPPRPGGYSGDGHLGRRLDRMVWQWKWTSKWGQWISERVLKEYFLDAHSIRPYSVFKDEIDILVDFIMRTEKI